MLGVDGGTLEKGVGDLGIELRSTGPHHLRHPHLAMGVGRVPGLELSSQRDAGRVEVRHRHVPDRVRVVHQVDRAPVRQAGDHELGQLVERGLVVVALFLQHRKVGAAAERVLARRDHRALDGGIGRNLFNDARAAELNIMITFAPSCARGNGYLPKRLAEYSK